MDSLESKSVESETHTSRLSGVLIATSKLALVATTLFCGMKTLDRALDYGADIQGAVHSSETHQTIDPDTAKRNTEYYSLLAATAASGMLTISVLKQ